MKLVSKLLSILFLYSYSFGIGWLATISESGASEALKGGSRVAFFVTAIIALESAFPPKRNSLSSLVLPEHYIV